MRMLVTGATGFVGSWLTRRLVEAGHAVRILRRDNSDLSALADLDLEHAHGDVTDAQSVLEAVRDIDAVFHLAGVVAYARSARADMERVNVTGTANVVDACRRLKTPRLVHMSSVVAVGASLDGREPLNEDSTYSVGHLNLGYFETKRSAELIVLNAVRDEGVDAVVVNPSTVYGPGDARKGSRTTQLKVAQGRFPFYPPGGANVIDVEDVVSATIRAWETGRKGERYILAGENLLIRDLFRTIAEAAGVKAPAIPLPNKLVGALGWWGDRRERLGRKTPFNSEAAIVSRLFHWFDSAKAQRELGLDPKPAKEAIGRSVDWMREQGMLGKG